MASLRGLWERVPRPIRYLLDVGRIYIGLHGLGGLWATVVSLIYAAGVLAQSWPWAVKAPLGLAGVLASIALVGHVGAAWKLRKVKVSDYRPPSKTDLDKWRGFIRQHDIRPYGLLTNVSLYYESNYLAMRPHLTDETIKQVEGGSGFLLSLRSEHIKRLVLRDLEYVAEYGAPPHMLGEGNRTALTEGEGESPEGEG